MKYTNRVYVYAKHTCFEPVEFRNYYRFWPSVTDILSRTMVYWPAEYDLILLSWYNRIRIATIYLATQRPVSERNKSGFVLSPDDPRIFESRLINGLRYGESA